MAHDRQTLKRCGWTTLRKANSIFTHIPYEQVISGFTGRWLHLFTASASAAEVETIVLFYPKFPKRRRAYKSTATATSM